MPLHRENKKMEGVILDKIGGEFTLVKDLDIPTPGPGQILVKSLATGINPVEGFQQQTGMLVQSFPIVLGCDASGIAVECGSEDSRFKHVEGTPVGVFGCTSLGQMGYGTFQQYFLMDERLAFRKPWDWKKAEMGATVGVGLLTACLGLISGMKIPLAAKECEESAKWIVILGAAGGVGQFAVQVAKVCGFKVLASCSPSNDKLVKSLGADAMVSYKIPLEEQLKEIDRLTGGKFSKVYDCSGMAAETGMAALATSKEPGMEGRIFATTNDWMPIEEKEGIEMYKVALGVIGKSGDARIDGINNDMASFIPILEKFLESGQIKPLDYVSANDGHVGFESVLKGLEEFKTKKSDGKKLVVRVSADWTEYSAK